MPQALSQCPVCQGELAITRLSCRECRTAIEGDFSPPKLCTLAPEHLEFIEVFVRCRGNIKEVERDLGISYPTVRARLEDAIRALGYEVSPPPDEALTSKMLNDISEGRLTVDEAIRQIRKR
jgi:hypothetical protein